MFCVDDLIYYGRYYIDQQMSEETQYWYCRQDEKIYNTAKIKELFGFHNVDDIVKNDLYVPLFRTDIIALEKKFMQLYPEYEKYVKGKNNNEYDYAFKTFLDEQRMWTSWYEFERNALTDDAVAWCKANNIKITSK